MRSTLIARATVLILMALSAVAQSAADELAFVRTKSGAEGQGWLFNRGGACYLAVPKHVLLQASSGGTDETFADISIARTGREASVASATRCAVFPNHDLALMRLSGVPDLSICGAPLTARGNVDALLSSSTQASLLSVDSAGGYGRFALRLRAVAGGDPDNFWVTPEKDTIPESRSGGQVTIQDRLAGLLLTVQATNQDAEVARVLKIDRIVQLISRLFDSPNTAQVDAPSCLQSVVTVDSSVRPAANSTGVVGNVAAPACGAVVEAWSSPPLSASVRPEGLLGRSNVWRSSTQKGEVTLDVRLCGPQAARISSVTLDTTGCDAADNDQVDIEVLAQSQRASPLTSFGFAQLSTAGETQILRGASVLAQNIRLRIVPKRYGAVQNICLAGLSVR
jgi:hypothetical protein